MIRRLLRSIRPLRALYGYYQWASLQKRFKQAEQEDQEFNSRNPDRPLPPPELRYRVHGSVDREGFLVVGANCARDIRELLEREGWDLYRFLEILDFGCGCGKVLPHFHDIPATCRFHGTDIDPDAVAWCRSHLRETRFDTNSPRPPTEYETGTFDLVYAISVFTHLDEASQFAWLEELSRITRPGGAALLTVHGSGTTKTLGEEHREMLRKNGFLFTIGRTGRYKLDGLPDDYQVTYHTREYVLRAWSRYFKIRRYVEGGINNHQDAVILTRE